MIDYIQLFSFLDETVSLPEIPLTPKELDQVGGGIAVIIIPS